MVMEETKTILYRVVEGDILEMIYKNDAVLGVKETEENHQLYLEFTKEQTLLRRLVILGENMSISPEARVMCQKFDQEETHRIKAQAIVCQNYFNKILAYIYFRMFTPKYPNKVFQSREKAISWIKEIN